MSDHLPPLSAVAVIAWATSLSSTVTVLPASAVPEIVGVGSLVRPPLGTVPVISSALSVTPVITGAAGATLSIVII